MLGEFSLLALWQCCVWNTWGPVLSSSQLDRSVMRCTVQVVETVRLVFPSWSPATVSLLANWGAIAFLLFLAPALYLQGRTLRGAVIASRSHLYFLTVNLHMSLKINSECSAMVAAATVMRCLFLFWPGQPDWVFTLLAHLAAVINGIPGIVVTAAPAAVSAAWFPPHQRVTATSISQMLNNIGTGASFLLASLLVGDPAPAPAPHNTTATSCTAAAAQLPHLSSTGRAELKVELERYLVALSLPALLLFAATLVFFPSRPPRPPSRSSAHTRLPFLAGAKQLLASPAAWLLAIVWSVPQARYSYLG